MASTVFLFAACCLVLILTCMLTSIMSYGIAEDPATVGSVDLGNFRFNWTAFVIGEWLVFLERFVCALLTCVNAHLVCTFLDYAPSPQVKSFIF